MPLIKKSELTVEQMEAEIKVTKKNPLLPNNLKEKYIAILQRRINAKKGSHHNSKRASSFN